MASVIFLEGRPLGFLPTGADFLTSLRRKLARVMNRRNYSI